MPRLLALATVLVCVACTRSAEPPAPAPRPSILLVTLDTTRADAIGPDTPSLNALIARGRVFRQAYATTPQTLPSHSSMLTGLYAGGHGVHENARVLADRNPVVAEKLHQLGYRTAAFVSAFTLARRFGLARGFDTYDDELDEGKEERSAQRTTDRALALLAQASQKPLFLWVHYFDPHAPYEPPDPYREKYAANPYRGEVAAMDEQLGRLLSAFDEIAGPKAILIAGDHGEGLGEHGESQHGNLVYNSTMHVPLVISGPGVQKGASDAPVSARRVFHTILDFAGGSPEKSLRNSDAEVVLGESMIPFLQFGWQPQTMAIEGRLKVIRVGALEIYDVIADPKESRDLAPRAELTRGMRAALRDYPVPSLVATPASQTLDDEDRRRLSSLGYITADATPVVRKDAPRPRDMAHLFGVMDQASGLFVREEYAPAIPLFERILAEDPQNLMAALRLAVAHSSLGHDGDALAAFNRAESIAPQSPDVRNYLALHYARTKEWQRAVPMLERVVAESPDRLSALEALAALREREGRVEEAIRLRQRIGALKPPSPAEQAHLGELAMAAGQTQLAIDSFEAARRAQGSSFRHDLELGVLYLATRRFEDSRAALDRVPQSHPDYAMALFKRAQVSVLLGEPDRAERIARARQNANATTRELIARERLFQ